MTNNDAGGAYRADDADALAEDLCSGKKTAGEAIEKLRTGLLDLSTRNQLFCYQHPKGRCVQIAGEPGVDLVFSRLYAEGKSVLLRYVPEPPPDSYEGKRPEAGLYAPRLGISTGFEFAPEPGCANGRRLHGLQTLLYPAELESQLRKITNLARTAIEETGSNMLFLVFGFLEFYDSEDSGRPLLAPLLSLPVELVRGAIDDQTRSYSYSLQHNGEDLTENPTLREKMRRDFMLTMPEFGEEDEPQAYFARIEQAIKNKRRWRLRRQLTLGMLSFGKLAIWADLDTKKNPGLAEHELIKLVFSGGTGGGSGAHGGGALHAEDYRIDELPQGALALIYAADCSQHSAIIDVLEGKNLVINGPPGSGKSQTITNLIAAALAAGKSVLFVSEKLAALEVVRHRLNQVGLGHFCLELHSHKTQKKKFLQEIQARIEAQFPASDRLQDRRTTLERQKGELIRHAKLMGSRIGNALGLTVHELFWAAERRRQELGPIAAQVTAMDLPGAAHWAPDDIVARSTRLASLATLYEAIVRFDPGHPWWGFRPDTLAPADDEGIARSMAQALEHARGADAAATQVLAFFGLGAQPDSDAAARTLAVLEQAPGFPARGNAALLARMFDAACDPAGRHSARLLSELAAGVNRARQLRASAAQVLAGGARLCGEKMAALRGLAGQHGFAACLLDAPMAVALEAAARLERAVAPFEAAARGANARYKPTDRQALDAFLAHCAQAPIPALAPFPVHAIAARAAALLASAQALADATGRIDAIAARHGLAFDATPQAVARLADPQGLAGLKPIPVDADALAQAHRLAALPFTDRAVCDIRSAQALLQAESLACTEALARCRQAVEPFAIGFDASGRAVAECAALARVAATAPADLLEYRRSNFGQAKTAQLIAHIRARLAEHKKGRQEFDAALYLDALPAPAAIRSAMAALRQKDGPFAHLDADWRRAKKCHADLCKTRRKLPARQRAEELGDLLAWMQARHALESSPEFGECFGDLFRGLETDLAAIDRLNDWYLSSHEALLACPGLVERIDLTAIAASRIRELAARADGVAADAARLAGAEAALQSILGAPLAGLREASSRGWEAALAFVDQLASQGLGRVADFFAARAALTLSPRDALRLMQARADLDGAAADLALLMQGDKALRAAGGPELGQLADLCGGRWTDALPALAAQAGLAGEVAAQACSLASDAVPLAAVHAFAQAKAELDAAWSGVAPLAHCEHLDDWPALACAAAQDAAAARRFLECLAPHVRDGVCARQFFAACDQEEQARLIVEGLAASPDMRLMLGAVFDGAGTDLDSLEATHAWGQAICALDLPAPVRARLLAPDAAATLAHAQQLYRAIDTGCRTARASVESLSARGSFKWDEWQKQLRADAGRDGPCADTPREIAARLAAVVDAPGTLLPWTKYLAAREQTRQDECLAPFVRALEKKAIPAPALASAFELAAHQTIARAVCRAHPELSRFDGSSHERLRTDYQTLDAVIVALTGQDFASRIGNCQPPEGQRGTSAADATEMRLLRREIAKRSKHIPIRQLVKRAGQALQVLKPCFMMGPLSVAQYLEQGALKFDLLVMDEASQLRPAEALGAIARAAQMVVVGDPKQLPPTDFFGRIDAQDDEDGEHSAATAVTSGMESILDICQQLFTPVRSLRWHYRSQHESLIAFSNHHFYDKKLIIFPSPHACNPGLGIKYRHVPGGVYQGRQNRPEAEHVVDAVLAHMLERPGESLGVVTLNQAQRELIEELLHDKLKDFPEGAAYMERRDAEGWPFFVKNLENVQGDERDVIFVSTTFGKAPGTNQVRQNFGPISRADGWRRLNVLFTRARRRIELFTSMLPEDIIADEHTPRGTKTLRAYLDFARRGILVTTDETRRPPGSDFEVSVTRVIEELGYAVQPQLGVAGYFIDMAVRNPDRPGEFLAAIECDGAGYHSGFSVRDRDRIRQEILESLGWRGRIHRIWSTDWFYDPRRAAQRLRSFLEERRRISAQEAPCARPQEQDSEPIALPAAQPPANALPAAPARAPDEGADLCVEVGDHVTYCLVDDPDDLGERHSVQIVDSESNTKMGIVNEQTGLAQALLGLYPGETAAIEINGQKARQLRVLTIRRRD